MADDLLITPGIKPLSQVSFPDHSEVEKTVAAMDKLRESIIREWKIPRGILIDEMSRYPSMMEVRPLIEQINTVKIMPINDSNNEKEKENMAKSNVNINTKEEEWIWVEGYKGTNKDMTCRDYQFEINKQFDMPEGADIEDCKSGFHFCKDLKDVFSYYKVGDGHRFFKVHALVRKKDYEEYGKRVTIEVPNPFYYLAGYGTCGSHSTTTRGSSIRDKLTSKSIVFLRELTPDEVFGSQYVDCDGNVWTAEDKALAMEHNIDYVRNMYKARTLVNLGYSEAFAKYIVEEGHYKAAYAAGTQEGLSMDMRVAFILREDC